MASKTQIIESVAMMILGAATLGASIATGFVEGMVFGGLTVLTGLLFLIVPKKQ